MTGCYLFAIVLFLPGCKFVEGLLSLPIAVSWHLREDGRGGFISPGEAVFQPYLTLKNRDLQSSRSEQVTSMRTGPQRLRSTRCTWRWSLPLSLFFPQPLNFLIWQGSTQMPRAPWWPIPSMQSQARHGWPTTFDHWILMSQDGGESKAVPFSQEEMVL